MFFFALINFRFAALHKRVGDTGQMEDLPDIASGQSHRAALHAAMRAREGASSQRGDHGNRLQSMLSAVRGSQPFGARGHVAPSASNRTTSFGGITKPGRAGPPHRSATDSFGLDPALNINNDPSEDDSRVRGRGGKANRGNGRARGSPQQRSPVPARQPQKPQRPQRPVIDFARKIVDPSNFMSSYRRTVEFPVASTQSPEALAPLSVTKLEKVTSSHASAQPKDPKPPAPLPMAKPEEKNVTSTDASVQPKITEPPAPLLVAKPEKKVTSTHASPPFKSPSVSSITVPPEKTTQFTKPNARSTASDNVVDHMRPYAVETPTPPARSVAPRKILPLKKSRLKAPTTPIKTLQPLGVGFPDLQIKWKVSPGEYPRKKETLISGPITPVAPRNKSRIIDQEIEPEETEQETKQETKQSLPFVPQVVPKVDPVVVPERQGDSNVWSGSLLDTDNPPIPGPASDVLIPVPSPAIADLDGVEFYSDKYAKDIDDSTELSSIKSSKTIDSEVENLRNMLDERLKGIEERLKVVPERRSPSITGLNFEEWLKQADPREAARIQDVLRTASFTKHRFPSRPPSESSPDPSPVKKSKARVPASVPTNNDKREFADRYTGLAVSKVRSVKPLEVANKTLGPIDRETISRGPNTIIPPAKMASVPVKEVPQSRSVSKKALSLNDSIYASKSKENRADVASDSTRTKPHDNVPKVKVIGVQPFNPNRLK
jgi:hypothetical protein